MTRKTRSRVILGLVFVVTLGVWLISGLGLHRVMSHQSNTVYLQELSDQLNRRVEKAVDFVVIASTELLISGVSACGAETQSYLRRLALGTANTPNIVLVTEGARCFAFEEYDVGLPSDAARAQWVGARNPDYRLGRMEGPQGSLLGVSWGFGTNVELVVALDTTALLFDVLRSALRSHGRVTLSTDHQVVSVYVGEAVGAADVAEWPSFLAMSDRYPLRVEIVVDPTVLAVWRRDVPVEIGVLWALFGLPISGLTGMAVGRRRNLALDAVQDAMDRQDITPHFQPIVDLASGAVVGCEVLARWVKPDGTQVSPGYFVPLVEEHGLSKGLFEVLLAQAAHSFGYELKRRPGFYLAFNVTPDQLEQDEFLPDLQRLASLYGFQPQQVCIEVTERQIAASPDQIAANVEKVSSAGFRVAIDDAGTGHNGLSTLQALKAGTLKIDKFFIDQLVEDPRAQVMVEMFVTVARQYGMRTIAEGVESAAQISVLSAAGVNAIQGFYVSRPLPATEFLFALNTHWEDLALAETVDVPIPPFERDKRLA